MKKDPKAIALFVMSFGGVLFSGYLSGVKFFTDTCAFNESCPYFLGYPACYYGFALFAALGILSYLLVTNRMDYGKGLFRVRAVALVGIIFAGYFTFREIRVWLDDGFAAYVLGLPTCALGFIFFLAIFLISAVARRRKDVLV
jgi:uncharacterized membrane protein